MRPSVWVRLLRMKHYIKNLLVFLPLIFSGRLTERQPLLQTVCGFAAFCLLSSVIYIINDIQDVDKDRCHPTKCRRPIAAGQVAIPAAWLIATALLLLVCLLNVLCGGGLFSWLILAAYLALNLGYSYGLKHVPVVDIAILASGFLLRMLYGSAVTGIEISKWLYLTVLSMAFYLGLGKRRNELMQSPDGQSRPVLRAYTRDFLDKNMYLCVALAIVFYSLWSVDSVTIARVQSNALVWTVPLVILICMKYNLTIDGPSDGDPVEVLLGDKLLLGMVVLLGLMMLTIIYL